MQKQGTDSNAEETEEAEGTHKEVDPQQKLGQDMELVLAALVDFRRDMKALSRKVQQLTDTDGQKTTLSAPQHHPGFIE